MSIIFVNPEVRSLFRAPMDEVVGGSGGVFTLDETRDSRLIDFIRAEMQNNPNSGWSEQASLGAVLEAVAAAAADETPVVRRPRGAGKAKK